MGGVSIAMELIADAPPVVRNAWDETEQMRKAMKLRGGAIATGGFGRQLLDAALAS